MKIFISWSGSLSGKLGEALRDWLPKVIQSVTPYFTPSDVEKGGRWLSDLTEELNSSNVGILCITRDNLQSSWVLFEAGALSNKLEKSRVCPIIFGIKPTDLVGPLKQFQATEFQKGDFRKLLGTINDSLGEGKLPPKTLDEVFEKWWPDLESVVTDLLNTNEDSQPKEPVRTDRDLLEEILQLSRKRNIGRPIPPKPVEDLLEAHIELHEQQISNSGSYQDTLDLLRKSRAPIDYIARRFSGRSEKLDELIGRFSELSYEVSQKEEQDVNFQDDNLPF